MSILIHSPGGTACPGKTRCHSYDGTKRGGFVPGGRCSILPPSATSMDRTISCPPRNLGVNAAEKPALWMDAAGPTRSAAPTRSNGRASSPSASQPQKKGGPCILLLESAEDCVKKCGPWPFGQLHRRRSHVVVLHILRIQALACRGRFMFCLVVLHISFFLKKISV